MNQRPSVEQDRQKLLPSCFQPNEVRPGQPGEINFHRSEEFAAYRELQRSHEVERSVPLHRRDLSNGK